MTDSEPLLTAWTLVSAARPAHEPPLAMTDSPWLQTASPASAARPAHEPPLALTDSEPQIPIFEVAFRQGMWWSIPAEKSQQIYDKYTTKQDAFYKWGHRRYTIDFETWEQRNLNNDRRRSVRLVWVTAGMVDPKWTGQLPGRSESAEQPATSVASEPPAKRARNVQHDAASSGSASAEQPVTTIPYTGAL